MFYNSMFVTLMEIEYKSATMVISAVFNTAEHVDYGTVF